MSIKFKSSIESEGKIIQSKHRAIKHTDTVQTLEVKVVTKTAAHPEYQTAGSSNLGYTIDGVEGAYLELTPGITYRFDQSDSSNSGHPLRFYEDAAKTTAYTTGVTNNDSTATPGNANAYTQIIPTTSTPPILFYQCNAHVLMGSYAKFGTGTVGDTYSINASVNTSDSDDIDLNLNADAGNDSAVRLTAGSNISLTRNGAQQVTIAASGGALTIQDEGSALSTAATTLNFTGSGVTASGTGATKTINVTGGGGSGGQVTVQKNVSGTSPTQATDGSRTQFTITSTPASKNNLQIYIDGVYQAKTAFEVSGTTVTLDAAPATGAVVEIIHFTVIDANIFLQSHTTTSGQTSFNAGGLIATKNDTQVYIDGVYQNKGNYTVSGSNIVLNPAPATGAIVEIVNIKANAGSSGSVTWETQIQAANFNAAAGKGYFVNTTSNTVTVTLPSGSAGDEIHFTDYASKFSTNSITFSPASGQKILNDTVNRSVSVSDTTIRFIYQDDTKGWTANDLDPLSFTLKYLIVGGGGGGGGRWRGGGGGAGAVRTNFAAQGGGEQQAPDLPAFFPGTTDYAIVVGAGGAGGVNAVGTKGNDSSFTYSSTTITSNGGGGGGGTYNAAAAPAHGGNASGGGGNGQSGASGAAGGTYGYAGGSGGSDSYQLGGGGGGAGAVGQPGNGGSSPKGDGGDGVIVNILPAANIGTGSGQINVGEVSSADVYYGGGGSGGSYDNGNDASPGLGGGGDGGYGTNSTNGDAADPGVPNTGGGGGGSYSDGAQINGFGNGTGGNGGSGVVILRYNKAYTANIQSGGNLAQHTNSPVEVGNDKISVFISGSGNIRFS